MRLMLVEDKDTFRRLLLQTLKGSLWETEAFAEPAEALARLEAQDFDVLVTDLRLPGFSGLELLRRAKRIRPALRVVLMSAFGEAKDIVEAMRSGADDFLPKPFDLELFLTLLDKLRALVGAPPPDPGEPWIALSPAMRELDRAISGAAETTLPVLFIGAPGTGKGRASRRLHSLAHPRAPYAVVAASSLDLRGPDENLLRTVEGGSIYLRGLEEIGTSEAAGLVRAMDSGPGTRIHWLAGSRDPEALPASVQDRFGALRLRIPRLRDRKEDIVPALKGLLARSALAEGSQPPLLDRSAERQALEYEWPGNFKELGSVAAASSLGLVGGRLRVLVLDRNSGSLPLPLPAAGTLEAMLREVQQNAEGLLLRRALEAAEADLSLAAERLGLTVRSLGLRLRAHGIALPP